MSASVFDACVLVHAFISFLEIEREMEGEATRERKARCGWKGPAAPERFLSSDVIPYRTIDRACIAAFLGAAIHLLGRALLLGARRRKRAAPRSLSGDGVARVYPIPWEWLRTIDERGAYTTLELIAYPLRMNGNGSLVRAWCVR